MSHKGYTLNYFINFFKGIPDHRWTENTEQYISDDGDTVQKCALGHASSDMRQPANSEPRQPAGKARVKALAAIFGGEAAVESVNDGDVMNGFDTLSLGATPRGRILKALRNKKRTGDIFGFEPNE